MGSAPKPPDPYATAQAQAGANFTNAQQNTAMQNVNEYNPYGSKTYQQIGWNPIYDAKGKVTYAPKYQSEVQLSPDQQQLLAQETGLKYNLGNLGLSQSARLQGHLGKEMNTEGLQGWAGGQTQPTDRKAIEEAMLGRYREAAGRQNQAEDVQYANRGLNPGSQGYGQVADTRARALTDAQQQAFLASGEESRAESSFLNNLRQAQFTERTAERNQPINEIMAMMGGSGPTTPQFQPFQGSPMQAPNIAQQIYDNYNARSQQANNQMSGIFGIGSSIAGMLPWASMLSDRRTKQDIVPLGMRLAGVPLYEFRYRADPETIHIGVMADEARVLHPDVVMTLGGYDHVDYGKLQSRHDGGL